MVRIRTANKLHIHVENDQLALYGAPSESAGCVLRGVLEVAIAEPTKVKSIALMFVGKMTISWTELIGNGQERLFQDERTLINHKWTFLAKEEKPHLLNPGNYTYEFELALAGDLPESTNVAAFYVVQYQLKAIVERTHFIPNHTARRTIQLTRHMLPISNDFMESVQVANQWANKLEYSIAMPSKVYTHGDQVPVTIQITPIVGQLRIRYLTCTLKEYMVCRASANYFRSQPPTHSKIIYFHRDEQFGTRNNSQDDRFIVWQKDLTVPIPTTSSHIQYDVDNDAVRIRHKLKFVLSVENADGHISELRASLPIFIYAVNTTGLPSYEDTWRSLPYNPSDMLALIGHANESSSQGTLSSSDLPLYNSLACSITSSDSVALPRLPTYDEVYCLSR